MKTTRRSSPVPDIPFGSTVLKNHKGNLVICERIVIPNSNLGGNNFAVDLSQVRASVTTRSGKTKDVTGFYFDRKSLLEFALSTLT